MKKGVLLVIDGPDGCGKATQTELLLKHLNNIGLDAETIDFPQREGFFGKLIYQGLEEGLLGDFKGLHPKIASALYAADRWVASFKINAWLESGKNVIADRYVSANQIHQGGKCQTDEERKEFLEWLDEMEYGQYKLPRPAGIFYLDVPYEHSLEMMRQRKEKEEKNNPGRRVGDQHENSPEHQLAARESAIKMLTDPTWKRIKCYDDNGAMYPPKVVHEMIFHHASKLLR